MIQYNAEVIEKLAKELYDQAASIERTAGAVGALIFAMGASATIWALDPGTPVAIGLVVFGAMVGGALGMAWARPRAFALRVQAQMALCQVQIERNTRRTA